MSSSIQSHSNYGRSEAKHQKIFFFLNAAVKLIAFPFLSVDFEENEVFCDLTHYIAN